MKTICTKKIRKAAAMVLILSQLLPLASCKSLFTKKSNSISGRVIQATDPFFNSEVNQFKIQVDPDLKLKFSMITDYMYVKGCSIASYEIYYELPEELKNAELTPEIWAKYNVQVTALFDQEGNEIKKLVTEGIDQGITKDGDIVIVEEERYDYKVLALATSKDNEIYLLFRYTTYEMGYGYEIRVIDQSGNLLKTIPLKNAPTDNEEGARIEIFSPNEGTHTIENHTTEMAMQILENGNICVAGKERMGIYEMSGKKVCEIMDSGRALARGVFRNNGKYYILTRYVDPMSEEVIMLIKEVNLKTGALGQGIPADKLAGYDRISVSESGLYLDSFNGCARYDMNTEKIEEIFNWNDTDIDRSMLSTAVCTPYSDDEIYAVAANAYDNTIPPYLIKLERAEKNPHAGKKVIVVGGMNLAEADILSIVAKINADPDKKVRVALVDYAAGGDDGNGDVEQRLYLDIISGEGPDVIVNMGGYESLQSGNAMEDLNTYIDGSNGIDRNEYFDNILRAFEKNGKLYHFPVAVHLDGLLANSELLPYTSGWTYDDYRKSAESMKDEASIIKTMKYNDMLRFMLNTTLSEFVDYENDKVDFQNEKMRSILMLVKDFGARVIPQDEKYITKTASYGEEENRVETTYLVDQAEEKFKSGLLAARESKIYRISQVSQQRELLNGEGIYLGYPSFNGSSMAIGECLSMGINASSKYKDLAWEFIRSYLEMDPQDTAGMGGLLVRKANFEADCLKDMEDANKLYDEWTEENPYHIGYQIYFQVKKEDIDTLRVLMEKANTKLTDDEKVLNIICEEAAGYFAGDRTIDDIIKNIQNRTRIIVQEL